MQEPCVKGECFIVSLKEYAKESGVSYEAVRQQVKRYAADLEGHIVQQGRTQFLDDEAVAILDSHRQHRTMTIYDAEPSAKIQELYDKLEAAREENATLLRELRLQAGLQARLEAAETVQKALEASRDEYKAMAEKSAQEAATARQEATDAKIELAAYKGLPWFKKLRRG